MNAVSLPAGVKVLSVSELARWVQGSLEEQFASVWVSGEICDFKKHSSGHWYFSLRDKVNDRAAVLSAVMWASNTRRARFDPKDGLEVVARGRVTFYPPQGRLQFSVDELIAKGLGAQELALKQLKQKLFLKGYFAPERKRRLPQYPRCLALVTSPTGAAVRDMLQILVRRWPLAEVLICPVRVQGETAAGEIAAALHLLNRMAQVEVVILARGGGSSEDLNAFNDERVADAIFRARMPVVSAVGHEIDVTIADHVADVRALTPSEAAELVVPDRTELLKNLADRHSRLRELLWGRLAAAQQLLAGIGECRVFRRPLERIHDWQQRLDALDERLQRAGRRRLERCQHLLEGAAGRLETLSPLNVLGRGYSLSRRATDLQVIRSAQQVQPGDVVITTVQHGQFTSRVEEIAPDG